MRYRSPLLCLALLVATIVAIDWWLRSSGVSTATPEPIPRQEEVDRFLAALKPRANWSRQEFEEVADRCFLMGAKAELYREIFQRANEKHTGAGDWPTEYRFFAGSTGKGLEGLDVIITVYVAGTPERIVGVTVSIPIS